MSRAKFRTLVALALAVVVGLAWFGLVPLLSEPAGPVAVAAPSSSVSPTLVATPSTSPSTAPIRPPVAMPSQVVAASDPPGPTTTRAPSRPLVELPSSGPPTSSPSTDRALSLRLDELRSTYGLPGVSAAILFADGSIWRGTSGLADVAAQRPVTPDTEFAAASISKTFLAALILLFTEDGRLELDMPVRTYLPAVPIDRSITVRQLLDHTSGLHDFFYAPDIDKALLADRTRVWTSDDVLGYIGKPYFKPGKGWHYSNTNYVILGLLAEELGGEPLADQLRARFFAPLGLDHTRYQGVDDPLGPIARAYRFDGPGVNRKPLPLGDGTDIVPFTSVVSAAGSAGSIASTAEDLVAWARGLYGGAVLAPATLDAMVADVQTTLVFKPSIPYGLGVQAATVDGRPTLGHSGRFLGSRTVVRWLPGERIAIAVLTNQSRADPNLVVRALLRVVLGTPPVCTSCTPLN